jgi:hypothetical protein
MPRSVESYRRILWKLAEEYPEIDPAAVLRRPKKRRADVYRPSVDELAAVRNAATKTSSHSRRLWAINRDGSQRTSVV